VTTPSSLRRRLTMLIHMTVLALRYDTRPGRFRSGHRGESGFVRNARASRHADPTDASRTMKLHALQERIERGEYEVDPRKVADAIVARLSH
jgi:anti-sigma-28 factor FlgM